MVRACKVALAAVCLPVAFFAIVVLRGVSPRKFLHAYWEEVSRG